MNQESKRERVDETEKGRARKRERRRGTRELKGKKARYPELLSPNTRLSLCVLTNQHLEDPPPRVPRSGRDVIGVFKLRGITIHFYTQRCAMINSDPGIIGIALRFVKKERDKNPRVRKMIRILLWPWRDVAWGKFNWLGVFVCLFVFVRGLFLSRGTCLVGECDAVGSGGGGGSGWFFKEVVRVSGWCLNTVTPRQASPHHGITSLPHTMLRHFTPLLYPCHANTHLAPLHHHLLIYPTLPIYLCHAALHMPSHTTIC